MGIVGGRPESGIRIAIERDAKDMGPPWRYRGILATPTTEYPLAATLDASGDVVVDLDPAAPVELAEKVRLILRTVHRQSTTEGYAAPARKIERWRGEK